MLATTCYTRQELERYLQGRADDELSSAIEVHVESCSRCEDTLSELDPADDTLIRTLQVRGGPHADAPQWVERLANLPLDAERPSAEAGDEPADESPQELGDYELRSVLGRGGMSIVFAARHKHLGRQVALKVMLPATQQQAVSRDRFAREMRTVGGLDHPAIVRATDAGEWNETLCLVMEQIDGVDFNRVSRNEGPLRVADVCAIGVEAARGLAYAHSQGVVHRDIKPSNLMLDRQGSVKILDFGLARLQSAARDVSLQTTMGQLLGTLDYMAPEQASGAEVDARADIYALGATLFKLLTGAPPHGRSADMPIIEYLNRLANSEAPQVAEHRHDLPSELVELLGQMLQRDPARRTATAEEVARRLEPLAAEANLQQLAAGVVERTADSHAGSAAAIKVSLQEIWPQQPADPPLRPPVKPVPPRRPPMGPLGWAALAAAAVSFMGLAALTIVLTLKSPEGELRFESELDNVKVELVDEKDRVQTIAVDQDGTTTTVRAGRYRIRLDSPSDGIELTPKELIVTRGKTVIAKIKKIAGAAPAAADAPQRDPLVTMEAQLQLAEAAAELEEAKQQQEPDAELIKTLEEKLARLRALARPVPTEPVYEGRTLADWVAQMKFEQEEDARKTAAQNVLHLAHTRPADEQMELILDAGSRLFVWSNRSVDNKLFGELAHVRDLEGASFITKLDPSVAAEHVKSDLLGDDQRRRGYSLLLCAHLRNEIRQENWPGIVSALESRLRSETGRPRALTLLVLAACIPDASQASELLASIDTTPASKFTMLAIMHVADQRKLELPRNLQVAWAAAYIDKLADDPNDLSAVWSNPQAGPFRSVQWDDVNTQQQAEVNAVVQPLLKSFEQRLAEIQENSHDAELHLQAAIKSRILAAIVDQAPLTGAAKDKAVQLLNQRLQQLLRFRATHTEPPSLQMDTPAGVATAILLLTGSVPESIRQPSEHESSSMGEQLAEVRRVLLPRNGGVNVRGGRTRNAPRLADWYPYEMLAVLHEAESAQQAARRRPSRSARFGSLSDLLRIRSDWRVSSLLMVDYAASSDAKPLPGFSAAEFVGEFITASDVSPYLIRHPQFANTVTQLMEQAQNPQAAQLGFKLWSTVWNDEEQETKLLGWLDSGDPLHVRAAIQLLADRDADRFRGQWAPRIAKSIDRIADRQPLNARDVIFLYEVVDQVPNAGAHAAKYLAFWLQNPDQRANEALIAGLPSGESALHFCVSILQRRPDQAENVDAEQVLRALQGKLGPVSDADKLALQRVLKLLSDDPE